MWDNDYISLCTSATVESFNNISLSVQEELGLQDAMPQRDRQTDGQRDSYIPPNICFCGSIKI